MKEPTRFILLALAVVATSAAAQSDPPKPTATEDIILASSTASSASKESPLSSTKPRSVSSGIAAAITSVMPAYGADSPAVDSNGLNRPKNQIPRIPEVMMKKYIVREPRLPVFRKLDLYTPKGLIDLSLREHPGLRIGNFFNLNAGTAYAMIVDEELRAEKLDLQDLVRIAAIEGDTTDAKAQHEAEVEEAYMSNSPTHLR